MLPGRRILAARQSAGRVTEVAWQESSASLSREGQTGAALSPAVLAPAEPRAALDAPGAVDASDAVAPVSVVTAAPAGRAVRWRPWLGRPRPADLLCFAGIVLSGGYGLATIPLTPILIASHPVLLEALSGSTPAIVAAGAFADIDSKLQMTMVVAAALPGLMKFDVIYWWAGVLWGHRCLEWLGQHSSRAAAIARRAEQGGARWAGPVVLLSAFLPGTPAPLIYAAAGWMRLRLLPFLICDLIGSLAWAALLAGLGYELGPRGVHAANLISRYALLATIALLVMALAPHAWQLRRAHRRRAEEAAGSGGKQ
jgi:membrane-associated protein